MKLLSQYVPEGALGEPRQELLSSRGNAREAFRSDSKQKASKVQVGCGWEIGR